MKEERDDIVNALYQIMFVIPEVARFPAWMEHLQSTFTKNNKIVVGNFYGSMFHNWSVISRTVRAVLEAEVEAKASG